MFLIKSIDKLHFPTISKITLILFLGFSACTNQNKNNDHVSKYSTSLLNADTTTKIVYTHQFKRGYNVVYPAPNDLYYYKIARVDTGDPDSVSIKLYLKNTYPNFKNYAFQQDDSPHSISQKGEFTFKFSKKVTENTYRNLSIEIITTDDKRQKYSINVSYDPKIVHERSGRTASNNAFIIHETNVAFMEVLSNDFIAYTPDDEDKKIVQKEFGSFLKNATSENEKINILARVIMDSLESNRGVPSNEMNGLSPIEQYFRAKNNQEKVWCGNISDIFVYVCACFDIPARIVGLGNTYYDKSDPVIYHADYHTTTEIYNKNTGSWHLMDLTFYLIDAKTRDGRPLNFVDFLYLINSPEERKNIIISEYDPQEKKTNQVIFTEAKNFSKLMAFYKQNQKFFFPYKQGNKRGYYTF
ncbi:hypothetical protein JYT51_01645 [Candidatus Amoebophilus asiaticus]|nr:hypothetical protein [Candidatus Amoebophilus asiaticus]